ncbi:MAG: porin family protein, partial [Muribaculaceae bacterium]|nr:porin family protein [Muribaculaceae bacterium]
MKSYKKIILTLLVAICTMGVANAQFRFGVKAGLNINSLHLNSLQENFDKDNHCGYTLGVMTEFQVPIIGLAFDLSAMYTRMNSDLDSTVPSEEDVAYNKNFLEIPLNLKYKIGLPIVGSIITPYIFTGPSFAIKLDKNSLDAIKTKTCQV